MDEGSPSDTVRLENLWAGEFGNAYIERNRQAGEGRGPFWDRILGAYPVRNVLEVGCNIGVNLEWLARTLPARDLYGVDINAQALQDARRRLPGVNFLWSPARSLPFKNDMFDLVFTTGVLIHQPPEILPRVMGEIVRCSHRYVLCGEYYAPGLDEVPYREQPGSLFRQDFGARYLELFPELSVKAHGFLPRSEGGWDDLTYWLLEKGE